MSDHEISVRLLADKIGVSDRLIRQWKTGNSQPRFISGIYLVKALAQITKMKEEQIFYEIANRILKDN